MILATMLILATMSDVLFFPNSDVLLTLPLHHWTKIVGTDALPPGSLLHLLMALLEIQTKYA